MSKREIEIGLGIRRRHKYNVGPPKDRTWEDIVFDSRKEMLRWRELQASERAGIIRKLERQVRFDLHAIGKSGKPEVVGRYVADAVYQVVSTGQTVVEDTKSTGTETALWRWKRRHFELEYGIRIGIT